MKNKLKSFFLCLFLAGQAFAADGIDTLSWLKFKETLILNHPVMAKTNLMEAQAKARIRQAWGNFEPELSYNYLQKEFDGLNYYKFSAPEINLPLWVGMDLKASYDRAEGSFLNPENKLPNGGLSSVALNIPLGKGLLIDKRRAALKQAAVFQEANKIEQFRMINDLIREAGLAYANWKTWYQINELYDQALALAEERFQAVKEGFRGGDRPAIDTTEALTLVQQRQISFQQSKIQLQNTLYELSTFLWLPENRAVDAEALAFVPQKEEIALSENTEPTLVNNPQLRSYGFKLRDLEIERRLKAENIRPTVDLQIGLLNTGFNAFRNINSLYLQNNNKVGLKISFPLTFATARGDLAESLIKIKETQIEQSLVRNELEVKMKQNTAELNTLQAQLSLLGQTLLAHQRLLQGEETRFSLGESSLFLVNARENKLLEIKEKILETENKLIKNGLERNWISGSLTE